MLKALGVEEVDGVCSQDLQWAVDLDMHLGAPTGRHALFAELVEQVARRFFADVLHVRELSTPLGAEGLYVGLDAVMAVVEDKTDQVKLLLGPMAVLDPDGSSESEDDEADGAEMGGARAREVDRLFMRAITAVVRQAHSECTVISDLARPMTGGLNDHCKNAMSLLHRLSRFFGEPPILNLSDPRDSPFTSLINVWLEDKHNFMMQSVASAVEAEDWVPLAPVSRTPCSASAFDGRNLTAVPVCLRQGKPWSTSCKIVFEMLKETIDLFFDFVPATPAAMDFCQMLLQHCCNAVKEYTWKVREGTVAAGTASPTADAATPTDAGEGEEEALPRLDQQAITTMHNLAEVKGQFFNKMWDYFTDGWAGWQAKAYRKVDLQADPESKRRRKEATRMVQNIYEETVQDLNHAIGSTVKAVGQRVVFVLLRQPFVDELYGGPGGRGPLVSEGPGSLKEALEQGETLLDSSIEEDEAGPVVAALAASLGSASLAAWERAVFDGGRLFNAEAHQVLTQDLSQLIRFLYDTAKRQVTVGPMGRGREEEEEGGGAADGGARIELTRGDDRAISRLQGQMVLFGLDTHTLIEWYARRLSCRHAVISPESRGLFAGTTAG